MNDETYTFISTVKDRKATARSARYKVNGSRSRKVTMSSDYDTPAQRKRRNGPMLTYNMNIPHTKKELDEWPADIRADYLRKIIDTYHPSNKALGLMLELAPNYACTVLGKWGLKNPIRPTKEQMAAFAEFLEPAKTEFTGASESDIDNLLTPKDWVGVKKADEPLPVEPFVPTPAPVYDTMHFTFTGNLGMFYRAMAQGPLMHLKDGTFTFTIDVVRKEG